MYIAEYRIVLPMTVEEYQVAQLYSVAQASKNETGGGDGIEVLKNEPFTPSEGVQPRTPLCNGRFTTGQFTHKVYHLAQKVPSYIRWIAPKGALVVREEAWNAYPYCRTVVTNDYMNENFFIKIESVHLPDRGDTENAHGLDKETLQMRQIINIDIANDPVDSRDYKPDMDPRTFQSKKTGRGPLVGPNWHKTCQPVMCCYKLVTIKFKWLGLQSKVENMILKGERRIFLNFHREVFCWMDNWHGMTMSEIRALEDRTKHELDERREKAPFCGTKEDD